MKNYKKECIITFYVLYFNLDLTIYVISNDDLLFGDLK